MLLTEKSRRVSRQALLPLSERVERVAARQEILPRPLPPFPSSSDHTAESGEGLDVAGRGREGSDE